MKRTMKKKYVTPGLTVVDMDTEDRMMLTASDIMIDGSDMVMNEDVLIKEYNRPKNLWDDEW